MKTAKNLFAALFVVTLLGFGSATANVAMGTEEKFETSAQVDENKQQENDEAFFEALEKVIAEQTEEKVVENNSDCQGADCQS